MSSVPGSLPGSLLGTGGLTAGGGKGLTGSKGQEILTAAHKCMGVGEEKCRRLLLPYVLRCFDCIPRVLPFLLVMCLFRT